MKNCHFCNTNLTSLITYDIRHAFKNNSFGNYENKNFQLFIPSLGKNSCIDCGKNYYFYKFSNNKLKILNKRQINGKIKLSKKIDPNKLNIKEYCVSCNCEIKNLTINTTINNRENYIEGIGQFCSNCIIKYY